MIERKSHANSDPGQQKVGLMDSPNRDIDFLAINGR